MKTKSKNIAIRNMEKDNNFYKAFLNLNDFIEKKSIHPRRISDGESLSFSEAMKDVRKIDRSNIKICLRNKVKKACRFHKDSPKEQLEKVLKDDYTFNVTNLPEYMEGYKDSISPIVMEKLRNGEFSIQKTLDLHGFNKNEAQMLFEMFIRDSVKEGLNCVRVIHGRGLKSPDLPVLKDSLTRWIVRAMNRRWVSAFASCKMCDGGPGATYILLKKKPEKKKISIIK